MNKTIEERLSAVESAVSPENLKALMTPVVAEVMTQYAGTMVKIGVRQVAGETIGVLATPFVWVGEQISSLFTSDEDEDETEETSAPRKERKAKAKAKKQKPAPQPELQTAAQPAA